MTNNWKTIISDEVFEEAKTLKFTEEETNYLKKVNHKFPESLNDFMEIYDNIMTITESQVTMYIDTEERTITFTYE